MDIFFKCWPESVRPALGRGNWEGQGASQTLGGGNSKCYSEDTGACLLDIFKIKE